MQSRSPSIKVCSRALGHLSNPQESRRPQLLFLQSVRSRLLLFLQTLPLASFLPDPRENEYVIIHPESEQDYKEEERSDKQKAIAEEMLEHELCDGECPDDAHKNRGDREEREKYRSQDYKKNTSDTDRHCWDYRVEL